VPLPARVSDPVPAMPPENVLVLPTVSRLLVAAASVAVPVNAMLLPLSVDEPLTMTGLLRVMAEDADRVPPARDSAPLPRAPPLPTLRVPPASVVPPE